MLPETEPSVAPLPSCSVPPETIDVWPLKVFALVSTSGPLPMAAKAPPPLMTPA